MGIGVSVLLIAAGAILAFAVNASVSGLDLEIVGWILMGAGLLGLIWSAVLLSTRNRVVGVDSRPTGAHVVAEPTTVVAAPPVTEVRQVPVERDVV